MHSLPKIQKIHKRYFFRRFASQLNWGCLVTVVRYLRICREWWVSRWREHRRASSESRWKRPSGRTPPRESTPLLSGSWITNTHLTPPMVALKSIPTKPRVFALAKARPSVNMDRLHWQVYQTDFYTCRASLHSENQLEIISNINFIVSGTTNWLLYLPRAEELQKNEDLERIVVEKLNVGPKKLLKKHVILSTNSLGKKFLENFSTHRK